MPKPTRLDTSAFQDPARNYGITNLETLSVVVATYTPMSMVAL